MNALMHRDYQGNAPVKFYQYRDLLEIVNHGGLYGRARPENFPNVSDYRNPVVAEAMRVLGYVNRYNRGIATLQRELAANGNGPARFSFRLFTAFEAIVSLSKHLDPDASSDIAANPAVFTAKTTSEIAVKGDNIAVKKQKVAAEKYVKTELKRTHPAFRGKTLQNCANTYFFLKANPSSSSVETSKALGFSPRSVANYYKALQQAGLLVRVGPAKGGSWKFSA